MGRPNVDQFLQEIPEPLSDGEWISMELLIHNLNALMGYFMTTESCRASKTIWYAEQTIKNFLLSYDENLLEESDD
jgi:hypothetical protein